MKLSVLVAQLKDRLWREGDVEVTQAVFTASDIRDIAARRGVWLTCKQANEAVSVMRLGPTDRFDERLKDCSRPEMPRAVQCVLTTRADYGEKPDLYKCLHNWTFYRDGRHFRFSAQAELMGVLQFKPVDDVPGHQQGDPWPVESEMSIMPLGGYDRWFSQYCPAALSMLSFSAWAKMVLHRQLRLPDPDGRPIRELLQGDFVKSPAAGFARYILSASMD